jgi:tetratricopeptide (TPR) repeat protein
MLARRLTGSVRAPAPAKVPAIAYAKTEDAVDALKRRYEDKVAAARTSQAKKYTDAGMEAKAKGDMVAAANSLRVALSFDADNAQLKAAHEEAQRAADQLLVDQYLKQAEYEERSERWADAGRSWGRVARTQTTNAKAHERAGFCLVKAAGDLHDAVALTQRAVQLEPKNASYRRTMANVYLAAGLTLNAKRELEAALQLAPDDANTTALLKRIAKSS